MARNLVSELEIAAEAPGYVCRWVGYRFPLLPPTFVILAVPIVTALEFELRVGRGSTRSVTVFR